MTWEYALIGLVVGIIIGAVAMRFGNRKLRQQQALQFELEKNKAELEEYREELVSHFARSAECWITWRMTIVSCISIWRKALTTCCRTLWQTPTRSATVWKSLKPATIRRRSRCRATTLKAHPVYCAVAQNAIN